MSLLPPHVISQYLHTLPKFRIKGKLCKVVGIIILYKGLISHNLVITVAMHIKCKEHEYMIHTKLLGNIFIFLIPAYF